MRQVVTIPPVQCCVGGIFKKGFQRRRLNVAVAKHYVRFTLMAGIGSGCFRPRTGMSIIIMTPKEGFSTNYLSAVPMKPIA